MTLIVQDQTSLIDLNTASPQLLAIGFEAMGISSSDAVKMAQASNRYRRPPQGGIPSGSDLLISGFKHGPFESVEELYEFKSLAGINPGILSGIATISSRFELISDQRLEDEMINSRQLSVKVGKAIVSSFSASNPYKIHRLRIPPLYLHPL